MRWLVGKHVFSLSWRLRHHYSVATDAVDARKVCKIVAEEDAEFRHTIPPQLRSYFRSRLAALGQPGDCEHVNVASRFIAFELRKGIVFGHTGAVVHADSGQLVDTSLSESDLRRHIVRSFKPRRLTTTIKITGYSIPFLGSRAGHLHYGHFLLERMQQLVVLLRAVPLSKSATLLVRESMPAYQLAAISQLQNAYPDLVLRRIGEDVRVECEFLLLTAFQTTHALGWFARPYALLGLRDLYLDAYGMDATPAGGRRLYLSRNNQKLRRLSNEPEILPLLASAKFDTVYSEQLAHRDQVSAMRSASHVFAPSGSALANLLFCKPGTSVLMTGPADMKVLFWVGLALAMGLNFSFVDGGRAGLHQRFSLDPSLFGEALGELDKNRP